MLKLNASMSEKRPLPGVQFSSIQIGGSLEVEVADGTKPEVVLERYRELYAQLQQSISRQYAQITDHQANGDGNGTAPDGQPAASGQAQSRTPRIPGTSNGGNGHGNGQRGNRGARTVMATAAQKKAITAICRDRELDVAEVLADWDGDLERLTVKEASGVIDALKGKPAGNGSRR